jgi:hypothetical protein
LEARAIKTSLEATHRQRETDYARRNKSALVEEERGDRGGKVGWGVRETEREAVLASREEDDCEEDDGSDDEDDEGG